MDWWRGNELENEEQAQEQSGVEERIEMKVSRNPKKNCIRRNPWEVLRIYDVAVFNGMV